MLNNNNENKKIGKLNFDYTKLEDYEDKNNRIKYLSILEKKYLHVWNKDTFFDKLITTGIESYYNNVYNIDCDFRVLQPYIEQLVYIFTIEEK